MEMSGGGVFNLRPGQFTDDSEMAFHLLKALTTFNPRANLTGQFNSILIKIA
jgi:ADP-ribosylglycohydrolase